MIFWFYVCHYQHQYHGHHWLNKWTTKQIINDTKFIVQNKWDLVHLEIANDKEYECTSTEIQLIDFQYIVPIVNY